MVRTLNQSDSCTKVHGGVHRGAQRYTQRCAWRCAQRDTEVSLQLIRLVNANANDLICTEVSLQSIKLVNASDLIGMKVCTEVHGGVHRGAQRCHSS